MEKKFYGSHDLLNQSILLFLVVNYHGPIEIERIGEELAMETVEVDVTMINNHDDVIYGLSDFRFDPRIFKLNKINTDICDLENQIDKMNGNKESKEYLTLDEGLTKHFLALDSINAEGNDEIRQKRKESINRINQLIKILESKVAGKIESSIPDRVESASTLQENADSSQVKKLN